jgi:hypothetical protein
LKALGLNRKYVTAAKGTKISNRSMVYLTIIRGGGIGVHHAQIAVGSKDCPRLGDDSSTGT